jgi:hypothetical protein
MENQRVHESTLGKHYLRYCQLKAKALETGRLNLSRIKFFFPTLLLPLGIFSRENPQIEVIPPSKENVASYYNLILDGRVEDFHRSYLPIREIPMDDEKKKFLRKFAHAFEDLCGGKNTVRYLLWELIDNIYQHSDFSSAFVMFQKYPLKGFTELCIIDNGISIPKSYELKKYRFKTDIEAFQLALKGISTKSDRERGYGFRTSLEILRKGLSSTCFIASRNAALIADRETLEVCSIGKLNIYQGTIISTRIPETSKKVNLYDYLEP